MPPAPSAFGYYPNWLLGQTLRVSRRFVVSLRTSPASPQLPTPSPTTAQDQLRNATMKVRELPAAHEAWVEQQQGSVRPPSDLFAGTRVTTGVYLVRLVKNGKLDVKRV